MNAGAETARLEHELVATSREVEQLASELAEARGRAAGGLAEAVAAELEEVAMEDVRFEVHVTGAPPPKAIRSPGTRPPAATTSSS